MNKTQRPIDIVDFVNFVDFRMADTLPMSINEQFKRLVTGEKIPSDTDSRPMIVRYRLSPNDRPSGRVRLLLLGLGRYPVSS